MNHTIITLLITSFSYLAVSELLTTRRRRRNNSSYKSILGNSLSDHFKQDKNHQQHIHIVGGGISGLLIGFVCKELKIPFTIYEANETSCGGLLGSDRISFKLPVIPHECSHDNDEEGEEQWMIAERAANGVMWTHQVELLCERIGLMERVISTRNESKARFFVKNMKLTQFPVSLSSIFNVLTWRMWKLPLWNCKPTIFETLDEYFGFYFGEEIKNQFLEPAFAGIFGTTLNNLSVYGTTEIFPKLLYKSLSFPIGLVKYVIGEFWSGLFGGKTQQSASNKRGTHSFRFGMQDLINHLVCYIGSENIKLGCQIRDLSQFNNSGHRVVLTVPAYQAVNILKCQLSNTERETQLIDLLSRIRYTPIAICTVIVERSKCPKLEKGFGCLIPRNEGLNILGVLFNSSIFENRVSHDRFASLTCIMQDMSHISDNELLEIIKKELTLLFMNSRDESICIVKSSMKRWKCGIPVYDHHLYQSWSVIDTILKQDLPNVNLFGNYTGQISIRGMIEQACELLTSLEENGKC